MAIIGGVNLGNLVNNLLFFSNGSVDANWQGATKGFIGDVAVNGLVASLRTSGSVPYAGTLYTNAPTQGAWQAILDQNPTQSSGVTGDSTHIANLTTDLVSAFQQINALPVTPGFESRSSTSLDGLNTQNDVNEIYVINITSGFNVSSTINITGDPGDVFILRWDEDADPSNGYQGQVKFDSGGAIIPLGGLTPTNFINVAGDINSSGGGSTPVPPYPQGPRPSDGQGALINDGSDFSGGGFFTGYWLTTGAPDILDPTTGLYYGATQPLSNGIFVGGWYTITTQFSMTSGTSGVYVGPNPITLGEPFIRVIKQVSPDGGSTFFDADTPPGPNILQGTNPVFRFIVSNDGNETLSSITLTDSVLGSITPLPTTTLLPGQTFTMDRVGIWAAGQQTNLATITGQYGNVTVTDSNPANYVGIPTAAPTIDVQKDVSPDNGVTWYPADTPPGPNVIQGTNPQFRFTVTNTGNVTLSNVVVTDDVYGSIGTLASLAPGASFTWIITAPWLFGQQVNTATVTGDYLTQTVTASNPAYWVGVETPVSIDIEKYVSIDNGVTWIDADTPPGPLLPSGITPQFRFVVTNTGRGILTNIQVTDTVYGVIGTLPVLNPGQQFEWLISG